MMSQLMSARRFAPLFWAQFCSALNDNFLKNALGMLILFGLGTQLAPMESGTAAKLNTLAGVVFIAPFFFLSALGGQIADKFDKSRVAERIKFYEIPVALIAALGFYLHSVPILFAALAGFGIVGALFGPVKYGILPEALKTEELATGNALVEGATFLAILLGTIGGGIAVTEAQSPELVVAIILVLAVGSWLFARMIPQRGAAAPDIAIDKNPITSTRRLLQELKEEPRIRVGAHLTSWFWLIGIAALSMLPVLIKDVIGGTSGVYTASLVTFVVGIATGSMLAGRASHLRPNLALVPLGAVIMGLSALALAYLAYMVAPPAQPLDLATFVTKKRAIGLGLSLFALAVGGGLFIVPAFAAVQAWAAKEKKARVVAAVNVLNAAYMTVGGGLIAVAQAVSTPIYILFAAAGFFTLGVAVLVVRLWGKEGVRDIGRMIFQLVYDLDVKGLENIPKHGEPTIIAPNHVSMLEAGMLHSVLPGTASFAVNTQIAEVKWIKPFLRLINAYVLDPTKPLATRGLVNTVKSGETIVIFPEGRITITGSLMKVYEGTGMIADKADAWVVPVRVDGAERAKLFSYLRPTQIKKAWFPKVRLTFLPPVKLKVDPELRGKARRQATGLALQDIMADTAVATADVERTLFEAIADAAHNRSTAKVAVQDPVGTKLSMKKLVLGAQVLGPKLMPFAGAGEAIGVMLPNSAGVTVVLTALSSIGRVPAMINFTSGIASIAATCTAAGIKTVLTSRTFIERGRLEALVQQMEKHVKLVYLEDVRTQISTLDKIKGIARGRKPHVKRSPGDAAVILFTSGSEGVPKGVVLSHRNLLTNIAQGMNRVDINGEDKVFNALPAFHSFGLTVGTLMPLCYGIPLYMYPTPLHYRIIPEMIYDVEATIMFGTDTFLNGYARVAHPYDFRTVRIVLAGAEAVKERTRALYMEKFGVRILEGYGITETSPGLAMNSPLANKSGTVGRFVPNIQFRLEDVPGIDAVQGDLKVGRLYVKGPNVMMGYLKVEKPGVLETVPGGWYDTGDIVGIDPQGYIKIMGRAKRFAKIGGEMVSLSAAEAVASDAWPATMTVMVALPDLRKGERLVLLTTDGKATRAQFQAAAKAKGASEMLTPSEIIVVDKLPLLGSGKPDFVAALKMAKERTKVGATAEVEA